MLKMRVAGVLFRTANSTSAPRNARLVENVIVDAVS